MQYRTLGKTGFSISEVSLGTWQVGGKWGDEFSHDTADQILNRAVDKGINFIDTADVYGEGESERAIRRLLKSRKDELVVATKCGRKLKPHTSEAYQPEVLRNFVEESLKNMDVERLDLVQLHCPPTEVYYRPGIFEVFDDLKKEGKIANLGVSVEKVEEAMKAIEYPNVTTVQIIFNMFRHRPAELFFREASRRNVGIIVRVPLASGLLSGKFTRDSSFAKGDHRNFNKYGQVFDRGETFSGIDYDKGLEAVEEIRKTFPEYQNLAPVALRWILMFDEVSCIIPGASSPQQVDSNIEASSLPAFSHEQMGKIKDIYEKYIKPDVHYRW